MPTPLAWVRVDSNIAQHDKIQRLLKGHSPKRWQAFTSYVCSIGWSAGVGTDGHVPSYALTSIYGTNHTASLLVEVGLWDACPEGGWEVHNYAERQQLDAISRARSEAATRAANIRWHGNPNGRAPAHD